MNHDADLVRRYARHLRQRAAIGHDTADGALADHEAELLWALARSICGEGLTAHAPLLRRASLELLEREGRRLSAGAVDATSAPPRDCDEAEALKELGRALLEMRGRFEQQQ